MRFGVAANATAETVGHPHQVGILKSFVRPGQRPPPHPKSTGTMPHAEVGVQNDPIHAIVAAAQEILIQSAQPIRHGGYATSTPPYFKLPQRGHFFAARSAKKRRYVTPYDEGLILVGSTRVLSGRYTLSRLLRKLRAGPVLRLGGVVQGFRSLGCRRAPMGSLDPVLHGAAAASHPAGSHRESGCP